MTPTGRHGVTYDGTAYAPGAVFRVTRQATLRGYLGDRSWTQELPPGAFVTCVGYGPGVGADPGYGVEFTTVRSQDAGALHCQISPAAGSALSYRPAPGLLLPVRARPAAGLTDLSCPARTLREIAGWAAGEPGAADGVTLSQGRHRGHP